jgi:hypothetical protein
MEGSDAARFLPNGGRHFQVKGFQIGAGAGFGFSLPWSTLSTISDGAIQVLLQPSHKLGLGLRLAFSYATHRGYGVPGPAMLHYTQAFSRGDGDDVTETM